MCSCVWTWGNTVWELCTTRPTSPPTSVPPPLPLSSHPSFLPSFTPPSLPAVQFFHSALPSALPSFLMHLLFGFSSLFFRQPQQPSGRSLLSVFVSQGLSLSLLCECLCVWRNIYIYRSTFITDLYIYLFFIHLVSFLQPVATYYGESESLDFIGNISWPGGRVPKDRPDCGFDNSLCEEHTGEYRWLAGWLSRGI